MAAKVFAVGDVLPVTTQLRISWHFNVEYDMPYDEGDMAFVKTDNNNFSLIRSYYADLRINGIEVFDAGDDAWNGSYTNYDGDHPYIDIDTTTWTLQKRTVTTVNWILQNHENPQGLFTWEDLNAPSGYTITFNSNGGTTISDIEDATELPTLPIPTKSGYTFVAWYYESNFQTRAKAGDTIESNVTLYAKWHNLGSLFTEIANAIRSKDGTSENIRDVDFGERIKQIQGTIELTQAEYDALETKDTNTYYLIVEVE